MTLVARLGTDISRWQDAESPPKGVNFTEMSNGGAEYTIFKAGQADWVDYRFNDYVRDSNGILPRGAYWYYDNFYKPAKQAEVFSNAVRNANLELPIWCDYESRIEGPYGSWKHVLTFMTEVERLLPEVRIGIYTGYYYWLERVPEEAFNYFKDYPLWLAWYTENEEDVWIPQPWSDIDGVNQDMTLWQFTSHGDGTKFGVNTLNIDLNNYYGTSAEWNEFTSGFYDEVVPPIDPPVKVFTGKTLYGLNARTSPEVNDVTSVGGIWQGHELSGEALRDGDDIWFKTSLYIAAHYNGVDYMELSEVVPPEPIEYSLVPKEGKDFVVIYRTPDIVSEIHKTQFSYWKSPPEGTLKILPSIPKYRTHMREDGTTHLVTTWETETDRLNLERSWACVPVLIGEEKQIVHLSNGNFREIDSLWEGKDGNWSLDCVFILKEQLGHPIETIDKVMNSRDPEYFVVPDNGKVHVRTGHDVETADWNFEPRSSKKNLDYRKPDAAPDYALPDTVRSIGNNPDFIPLTEPMQWYWFEALVMAANGVLTFESGQPVVTGGFMTLAELKDAWKSVTRHSGGWCDFHAVEQGFTDFILGVNLDGTKGPIQLKILDSGGQMREVISETGSEVVVRAHDQNLSYDIKETFSDHCLWNWGVQSCCRRDEDGRWDGTWKYVPIPDIRQNGIKSGTPIPCYGHNGQRRFEKQGSKSSIYRLINGEFHSPYIFQE